MNCTNDELKDYLTGSVAPLDALCWLRDDFLPEIVAELNTLNSRRRLGIYAGERIPENERNLTDVRNRVSLIVEYEMARIVSQLLDNLEISELFCGYVVANRFPDLEMRQCSGKRGLRFEVKCLQTIAEEKSANFDTLRKDLNPQTDFVVVFLWEWQYDPTDITWDRAVRINKAFVFHASSLALLRDWYWLNKPPAGVGGGYQGFDLRWAVNCRDGNYNEEEGNYGKLLRIWQKDFEHEPPTNPLVEQTIEDYLAFKSEVISAGFDTLAHTLLPGLSGVAAVQPINRVDGINVGWQSGEYCFLLNSALGAGEEKDEVMSLVTASHVITMTDKYSWREFDYSLKTFVEVRKDNKPKRIIQGQA